MSDGTKIEWTDASWNPLRAHARGYGGKAGNLGWHCEHVSEGCRNCYAEGINRRLGNGFEFKPGKRGALDIFLDEKTLLQPLKWKKPRTIFVCSMTDLFADFVSDEMIDRVFAVMALCSQHRFQVLTKRSARMRAYVGEAAGRVVIKSSPPDHVRAVLSPVPWPLPNVWLGVSCEDQARADERIPHLLATPAAVRFVSLEPLLGAIDLMRVKEDTGFHFNALISKVGLSFRGVRLNWVIVGGESGPNARPMHPDWARKIRDDCASAGTPFFFKQWGEHAPTLCDKLPVEMIRVGKKRAGRLLDGVEHSGMPL